MMDRRTHLRTLVGVGAVAGAPAAWRLRRTDAAMAALFIDEIRPGDVCDLRKGLAWWRGQPIGFVPPALAGETRCVIDAAGLDDGGRTRVMVRRR